PAQGMLRASGRLSPSAIHGGCPAKPIAPAARQDRRGVETHLCFAATLAASGFDPANPAELDVDGAGSSGNASRSARAILFRGAMSSNLPRRRLWAWRLGQTIEPQEFLGPMVVVEQALRRSAQDKIRQEQCFDGGEPILRVGA